MSSKMSLITVLPTTQIIHQTERSKKSRKVNHNATTSFFVNTQQQQQNCLFFNNHPKNDMHYKEVLPGNTSYSGITQSGK